jgi:septum formation topological specificity factor MinE
MDLREEILKVCTKHNLLWSNRMTDDILKIIIKRIDKEKEEFKTALKPVMDAGNLSPQYYGGYISAMLDVKRMLK